MGMMGLFYGVKQYNHHSLCIKHFIEQNEV